MVNVKLWMTGLALLVAHAHAHAHAHAQVQDEQIVPVPHQVQSAVTEDTGRAAPGTAADLLQGIYSTCLETGDLSCAKHKVLAYLSAATTQDKLRISRDLSIVRSNTGSQDENSVDVDDSQIVDPERRKLVVQLERVSRFLDSHELRVRLPKEILSPELLAYVPSFLLKNLPQEIRVPLADNAVEGRSRGGMLRKVIIPFLLGIKFKISTLLPLALALIALKTWKALTLGLLSIVLSAAMVIFKITKPKVLNYEVVHLPHPHPAPVVEHYEHHHGYGRALDAQPLAYRAYLKQ